MLSVLLIDDEPALLDVLKPFIERSGEIHVRTALSATEALKLLPEQSFDVVIVDYSMPEINGIDFLKILRSKGDTTPVIIFTGVGNERIAIEAINYGANFFLKKEEDPKMLFPELCTMIKNAAEVRYTGKKLGSTSRKIISDMINFTLEPTLAIDQEGKVVAWNDPIAELTQTPASEIMGSGDYLYAVPFFGTAKKMLINLVFEPDELIKRQGYTIVNRVPKGPVVAVTRGLKKDGSEWTLWSKAMPVYDQQGNFIAAVGIVRDVTATFGDSTILNVAQSTVEHRTEPASRHTSKPTQIFNKILATASGKASLYHKEGVSLYRNEKRYHEAIDSFNKALEIDDKLPYVWNDLGLCYRETGDNKNALKSLQKAIELAPENPEFLYNLGETLEKIGMLNMSTKYLDLAVQTFKRVAEEMPNNADAWNHIGICCRETGKSEESKACFDRVRDLHLRNQHTPIKPKRDA